MLSLQQRGLAGAFSIQNADFSFPRTPWWNSQGEEPSALAGETGLLAFSVPEECTPVEFRRSACFLFFSASIFPP